MSDVETGRPPSTRRTPGVLWIVVPMLVSALVFGAIAVAVRSGDDDGGEAISGPAAQLPAVVAAAEELIGTVPAEAAMADELGRAYGEVTLGFAELAESGDELAFAERFERLPDAEARLLGRSLAEIQTELSPTAVDGGRGSDDRKGDVVFALQLSRTVIQTIDPDAAPRQQALAMMPFKVQDLTGFDQLATTFATGDLTQLATTIDVALSDAGAAELISSVAFAVGERLPTVDDVDYPAIFTEAAGVG